jgi:diguanylate cyclase
MQLSATVPAAQSLEQLTRPLLEMLGAVTGLETSYLTSIDLDEGVQHVRFARNIGSLQIPEGLTVPWADTLCKRALDEGRMFTSDVAACWGDSDAARQLGIQTYVSTPIRGGDGALLGTLCAASADQRTIAPDAQAILQLFSQLIAQFIERERLLERLRSANEQLLGLALTDALTGLPNRRALFDELQRLLHRGMRERSSVLVGVIDLDGFKRINDRHGHLCGDEFLRQLAGRLSGSLRGSDMLGRIGGDEFLLIGPGPALPARSDAGGPLQVGAEALHAALAMQQRSAASTIGSFELGQAGLTLQYGGASVGVVALDPTGLDAEAAFRLADERMYQIKAARQQAAAAAG